MLLGENCLSSVFSWANMKAKEKGSCLEDDMVEERDLWDDWEEAAVVRGVNFDNAQCWRTLIPLQCCFWAIPSPYTASLIPDKQPLILISRPCQKIN